MTPEHLATFASYFNVHRAPAMLLATLYAAGGRTVSRAELQDGIGIAKSTLTGSAFLLHAKLPSGSVECLTRAGYRLTGVGLDACAFAIAEVAAQPEPPPTPIPVRKPMDMRPGALWSDAARLKILKDGVAAGVSFSQIARQIGHGCTRNAALGKAHRSGWRQPGKPAKPTLAFNNRHRDAASTFGFKKAKAAKVPPAPKIPPPTPTSGPTHLPRAVVPERNEAPGACTILTIGGHMCRWPIGDPKDAAFSLCGAHATGIYCERHTRLAYAPAPVRDRVDERLGVKEARRA